MLPVTVGTIYSTKNTHDKFDKNKIKMQQVQHFVLFVQPSAKYNAACKKNNCANNDKSGTTCKMKPSDFFKLLDPQKNAREKTHLEHDLEHKKLHAKRPIWSTIWATKKLHAKRPIWSTIWSTKSCTRKDPFGARFGAQKVAKTWQETLYILFCKMILCSVQFLGCVKKSGQPVQSVLQFVNCQLCRMAAMSKMARHCEEDIANKSQSTRTAYSKINHFWGDVFAGGPTNKTLLLTVTDIRLESKYSNSEINQ